jgi:hypothetical protein
MMPAGYLQQQQQELPHIPDRCPKCQDEFCVDERCTLIVESDKPISAVNQTTVAQSTSKEGDWIYVEQGPTQDAIMSDAGNDIENERVDVQVAMVLDTTGSMSSMLAGAKRGLKSAWDGIQTAVGPNESPQVAVISYKDYCDAHKNTKILNYTHSGNDQPGSIGMPSFSPDKESLQRMLDPERASGGGDEPECVEAALALATQLPWDGQIQSMYIALDAPPHACGGESRFRRHGDNHASLRDVQQAQHSLNLLQQHPGLASSLHPEDWLTQVIVLARRGVIINPMICTEKPEVVFLAAFMAEMTGGQAVFLTNRNWEDDNLEKYVREYTIIELEEHKSKQSKEEAQKFAQRLLELPKQYNMRVPDGNVVNALAEHFPEALKDEVVLGDYKLEGSWNAANRLAATYNRCLQSVVKTAARNNGIVCSRAEEMEEFVSSVGMAQSAQMMCKRSKAKCVQQMNYSKLSSR